MPPLADIVEVACPLFIVTGLNVLSFFIPTADLGAHLGMNVTLLLASLANLYIVGGQLPKTNFLTPIDDVIYFTLFCES